MLSAPETGTERRTCRLHWIEERRRSRSRRGGLLGFEGRADATGARRRAGMGERWYSCQHAAPECRLRHSYLDRRSVGGTGGELWFVGRGLQTQERPEDRSP